MNKRNLIAILVLSAVLGLTALNCSSDGTSKVTIHINLDKQENAFNTHKSSIFDRFLSFFTTEAVAQTAQYIPNITSLRLSINGPGMDSINLGYDNPVPSSITVEVPEGSKRSFELLASTPSVTFRGIATADLSGGTPVNLPIEMKLFETKIIIPDYTNARIIQIDDMKGTNWTVKDASGFSRGSLSLYPSDIDFDSKGRIYIGGVYVIDSQSETFFNALIRIDDITSQSYAIIASCGDCYNYGAIAIDRIRNIVYYANSYNLYRNNPDGTDEVQLNITRAGENNPGYNISYISGMDVDQNGILYIAGNSFTYPQPPVDTIFKYNPVSETVENIYTDTVPGNSWDAAVKSGMVYVAHNDYEGNNKIIQFNTDLDNQAELAMNPNNSSDVFSGPHRFVALLNRGFYITDETINYPYDRDRIIFFEDISGAGWSSFGSTGSEVNQFNFYEYYSY